MKKLLMFKFLYEKLISKERNNLLLKNRIFLNYLKNIILFIQFLIFYIS
jgi:hypothetical protein